MATMLTPVTANLMPDLGQHVVIAIVAVFAAVMVLIAVRAACSR